MHPRRMTDRDLDKFADNIRKSKIEKALELLNTQIQHATHKEAESPKVFWSSPIWTTERHSTHLSGTNVSALFKHLRTDLRSWNVEADEEIAETYRAEGLELIRTLQANLRTDKSADKPFVKRSIQDGLIKILRTILNNPVDCEHTTGTIIEEIWSAALKWTWLSMMYSADVATDHLKARPIVREMAEVVPDDGMVATVAFLRFLARQPPAPYGSSDCKTIALIEMKSLVSLNYLHSFFMFVAAHTPGMPWNSLKADWCDGVKCNHPEMHRLGLPSEPEPESGQKTATGKVQGKRKRAETDQSNPGTAPAGKEQPEDRGVALRWTKKVLRTADKALADSGLDLAQFLRLVHEDFHAQCMAGRKAELHGAVMHFHQVWQA